MPWPPTLFHRVGPQEAAIRSRWQRCGSTLATASSRAGQRDTGDHGRWGPLAAPARDLPALAARPRARRLFAGPVAPVAALLGDGDNASSAHRAPLEQIDMKA